ncbi:MAG: hypothetical protein WC657_00910 [Candidatus Paceibacterota bacterium]|jgi:hypothetical protein
MDTFNPNQMPPMSGEVVEKKSVGPLIAVIIILALIIIAGLYFLKQRTPATPYMPVSETNNIDSVTASLNTQSTSDQLDSIQADLNATDINNLDQGAAVIDAQLQ